MITVGSDTVLDSLRYLARIQAELWFGRSRSSIRRLTMSWMMWSWMLLLLQQLPAMLLLQPM